MSETRCFYLLTFPGAELLDIAGPAAVLTAANEISGQLLYRCEIVSVDGAPVRHGSGQGLAMASLCADDLTPGPRDTLLVAGAYDDALVSALADRQLAAAIRKLAPGCERIGSVCSGTFLLAAAGVITDQRVATHWRACRHLSRRFPDLDVDPDALYVQAGRVWTSAGVTTGIDMALAMLEADHGRALKVRVARQLVVYTHRPGAQSQFSEIIDTQARVDDRYGALIDWLQPRLDQPIRLADMAAYCGQSERTFHRRFTAATGTTPARFLEALRMARSRDLLEAGMPVKQVAGAVGFRSEAAFRTAFRQHFGIAPGQHARMQASAEAR